MDASYGNVLTALCWTASTSNNSCWTRIIIQLPASRCCSCEVSGNTEQDHVEVRAESIVHPIVDDRVHTGVRHG